MLKRFRAALAQLIDPTRIIRVERVEVKTVIRLDYATFLHLRKGMPQCYAGNTTTDVEAGFKMGVRYALDKIEEGIVLPPK